MKKTITATALEPGSSDPLRIYLNNTHGIVVGRLVIIGTNDYTVIKIDQLSIEVIRRDRPIPVGAIALFIEP